MKNYTGSSVFAHMLYCTKEAGPYFIGSIWENRSSYEYSHSHLIEAYGKMPEGCLKIYGNRENDESMWQDIIALKNRDVNVYIHTERLE